MFFLLFLFGKNSFVVKANQILNTPTDMAKIDHKIGIISLAPSIGKIISLFIENNNEANGRNIIKIRSIFVAAIRECNLGSKNFITNASNNIDKTIGINITTKSE